MASRKPKDIKFLLEGSVEDVPEPDRKPVTDKPVSPHTAVFRHLYGLYDGNRQDIERVFGRYWSTGS